MPRIAFDHPEIDQWCEEHPSQGSSTFDLCRNCFNGNKTAEDLGLDGTGCNGDPIPLEATFVKEIGADGFIDEVEYTCECCDVLLTSENY